MPLISIIVPVYNAEKYIRKCLDSIKAQTHTDWEAILVDDGSPDNSGAICDEYAAGDSRFKVIHQQNGGVSVARQTGLDNATGEYIIHCDPDDWIDPTMLEELLAKAIEENADMVICDFWEEENGLCRYNSQNIPTQATAKDVQELILNCRLHGSCCNKLVRSSACKNIGFFPSEISLCEDELFHIKVLNNDIKVTHLPKAFYHYRRDNNASICNTNNKKTIASRIAELNEIKKIIVATNEDIFFPIKKEILSLALKSKEFSILELYPEIHSRIITENKKYRFFTPLSCCLAIALKKHYLSAYYIYNINMFLLNIWKNIKRFFYK